MESIFKVFKRYYKKFFRIRLICYVAFFAIAALLPLLNDRLGIENLPIIGPLYLAIADKLSFAVFVAIVIDEVRRFIARSHEEEAKTESDHHLIIRRYTDDKHGHKVGFTKSNQNYYEKDGCIMQITNLDHTKDDMLKPSNREKHSKDRKAEIQAMIYFIEGDKEKKTPPSLNLPSLNVFTNVEGDFKMTVSDSNQIRPLSGLLEKNIGEILAAHTYSKTINNTTIRLNDLSYHPETKELHFDTMRSTYLCMLLTNRAMDYQFQGMTLRKFFEYKPKISPLDRQEFGNQIGINGLLITTDGYLLIEKRQKDKTTWKDKFGQPISLAFKVKDAFEPGAEEQFTDESIQSAIVKCIEKTLKSNYGLKKEDYKKIVVSKNMMGIARDLLEGGKPNIYFYVELKTNAKETAELLQKYASLDVEIKDENGKVQQTPLEKEKLDSDYYLVNHEDFKIGYNYCLKIVKKKHKKEGPIKVIRKLKPRMSREKSRTVKEIIEDKTRPAVVYSDKKVIPEKQKFVMKKKCGEALLVCLSYLDIIKDRVENLKQ